MKLEGECNCCGLCCTDGLASCENLMILGVPGRPGATICLKWETRTHRMPIRMLYPNGTLKRMSECIMFDEYIKEGCPEGTLKLPKECSLVQIEGTK